MVQGISSGSQNDIGKYLIRPLQYLRVGMAHSDFLTSQHKDHGNQNPEVTSLNPKPTRLKPETRTWKLLVYFLLHMSCCQYWGCHGTITGGHGVPR